MANTFVCAMCGGEFEKGLDEAEALAELKEVWGDISPDECDQVCDDCWEKVKPANNQELFANQQATQHGLHLTAFGDELLGESPLQSIAPKGILSAKHGGK